MRSKGYGLIEVMLAALILSLISSFAARTLIQDIKTVKYTKSRFVDIVKCKNALEQLKAVKFDELSVLNTREINVEHLNADLIKIEAASGKVRLVTLRSRY
jgi:prepilin-type N-terminal cleavage/methylation domain-containing protein